ncbi:MAG TPA: hypothetical protein VGJ42_03245 [Nitrososphaera sp.]
MIVKPMTAILLATLVAASGAVGSFYFGGAQEQAAAKTEIKVDRTGKPSRDLKLVSAAAIFGTNSDVPIYLTPTARANLTNGSASILQEVPANESTAAAAPEGGYFLGDALSTLEGLLGMNNNGNTTSSDSSGSLLVALDDLESG